MLPPSSVTTMLISAGVACVISAPVGSWQRALHARESAFYTRYLEVEDVRRALAKRENYPHTPLS